MLELLPRTVERLRLKGLLTDAQRIILWLERRTIVISMDRGLCPV